MKKYFLFGISALLMAGSALVITSCQDDEIRDIGPKFDLEKEESLAPNAAAGNSLIMPPNSVPFGRTFKQWTAAWWQYVMSFDCEHSPVLDATGAYALTGQAGPVLFLAGNTGGLTTRSVTIGRDKSILFPVVNIINDYPCPDPDFKPAPGQSIEDFLQEGADAFIDLAGLLEVSLDGTPIRVTAASRYLTDLFYMQGHPDLVNCLDPCVTGNPQAAVSDGYWIMLKKMKPGLHQLRFHAEVPAYGFVVDVTYLITVI